MQAIVIERVDQRADHVLLSDQFGEVTRTPFTCEDLIAHGPPKQLPNSCKCTTWTPCFHQGWRLRPATPQHPMCLLRLLPSGPDRVHKPSSPRGPALTAIIVQRA